jgi:halogenation protein CepH
LNSERGEITEEMAFREFERRYRREFGFFYQFLISFYDYHHDEASYFWQARKVLESSEEASAAFVRLVSGLSDAHEPVFAAEQPLAQAVMGLGQFFRGLEDKDHAEAAFGQRGKSDVATFMGGLTRELTQVQLQANLGERRPREAALFEDGLVPSRDGLLWCK